MAKVVAVNISIEKGTVKQPIEVGNFIKEYGLEGDAHAGKWHRQVSLLGIESFESMKELGASGLCWGKFAENITTEGLVLYKLPVGTKLQIGESIHEVTQIGKKCHGDGCEIFRQVGKCVMPLEGIFTRVIEGGKVRAGDTIEIIE